MLCIYGNLQERNEATEKDNIGRIQYWIMKKNMNGFTLKVENLKCSCVMEVKVSQP